MESIPWQVLIAEKSLKKRQKIRLLEKSIPFDDARMALDIGCAQGILSYYLRRRGGFWVSTDQDEPNLKASRDILGENLVRMPSGVLPFRSGTFDLVTCLDYLEHIDNDDECLVESRRVLKKGGAFILVTPHTGKLFLLHRLRAALGMKLEFYGHKREGYSRKELISKLEAAGFEVSGIKTYSRFFSEFIELLLNFAYVRLFSGNFSGSSLRDGRIRPSSSEEYKAQKGRLKAYSLVYPLVRFISWLDVFLFFLQGYSIMIWAKKR